MRSLSIILGVALSVLAACGGDEPGPRTDTYAFGPFTIQPGEEVTNDCVQISLDNAESVFVNTVELTTGPGFHHSNWFFVPDFTFPGPDGTFDCDERAFDQAVAAIKGGVIFAQSTQTPHEIQQFPEGVVVHVPPHHKLVTQIHLLNPTEAPLTLAPTIRLTTIPQADVVTKLAGVSFQNAALALPPNMQSRFTVECDLATKHDALFGRDPDFKFYYALAHYHELGTGLDVEAVRADGSATKIYSTATAIGDTLGGQIDPVFDMTGFTKIRFSCEFYNPRAQTVRWGVGDQEMCVFLAFSDSSYNWGGGVLDREEPQNPMMVGNTMTYSNPCVVFANDADRG